MFQISPFNASGPHMNPYPFPTWKEVHSLLSLDRSHLLSDGICLLKRFCLKKIFLREGCT